MDMVCSLRLFHDSKKEEEKKTPDAPSEKRYIDFGVWTLSLRANSNDTRSLCYVMWCCAVAINKSAWADTRAEQQQLKKNCQEKQQNFRAENPKRLFHAENVIQLIRLSTMRNGNEKNYSLAHTR